MILKLRRVNPTHFNSIEGKDNNEQQYYVDLTKYKGIYYNDDNKKYQDEDTGAHFEYHDLCRRLDGLMKLRGKLDVKEQ